MRLALITVVHGRHDHLRTQLAGVARSSRQPDVHVVVTIDDPEAGRLASALCPKVVVVPVRAAGDSLPIAAARNAGARRAIEAGARLLIFLDVDCIPSPDLVGGYESAARDPRHADALLCGPVTYLPPDPPEGWTTRTLAGARNPHSARPDPAANALVPLAAQLFWSLSFALTGAVWQRIGGFYEGYVGYGAEDTDFAATAVQRGVPILFVGHADAFHQYHEVSSPPVEHLDDILRNSNVFRARHGDVPMRGWLDAFAQRGLARDVTTAPRRVDAVRVATVPARHPYLDAVLPATVDRHDVARVRNWEPDPLLEPDRLRQAARAIDVVHVHFGYDHLAPDELAAWLAALDAAGIPLVLTAHDLRNPHHDSRERHDAHLQAMATAAATVITLTGGAAQEFEQRFGRAAEVIAHPSLLVDQDIPVPQRGEPAHILIPLKALRRNVKDPVDLVRAAAEGAARSGVRVRVLVEPSTLERPDVAELHTLDVDLDVTPYLPHDELCRRVARAHAILLPYRFGTHSGWVELCRDLGTHVIAPDCGHYAQQWDDVRTYRNNERAGLDPGSLADCVAAVCELPAPAPADPERRAAERDLARAYHDAIYRRVLGR